ncbi:MAG: regulatory protein RecX [Acidobacteriota bacterium]
MARRPHFRQELSTKLLARGFSDELISATLDRVDEEGLIDDRQNALTLAFGAMRRKGFGPRRMRANLETKGVDSEIAAEVVEEVFPDREAEVEAARTTIARWRFSRSVDRAKAGRHLERKGYSTGVVLQVLEELDSSL